MPMPRRPHVASPEEVKLTRDRDQLIIEYADPSVATTYLKMGKEKLDRMSDEELLAYWNRFIKARDARMRDHDYVAVEVPLGRPQVKYYAKGNQWVPRGDVLRCEVLTTPDDFDDPCITIDGRDYTAREFMGILGTFGGWGMRVEFVPDVEVHDRPQIEVREPED
jgi:hypothetical protein